MGPSVSQPVYCGAGVSVGGYGRDGVPASQQWGPEPSAAAAATPLTRGGLRAWVRLISSRALARESRSAESWCRASHRLRMTADGLARWAK